VSTTTDQITDNNYQFTMLYHPIKELLHGNVELVGTYMFLYGFANPQQMTAFPSLDTLSELTGKSKKTLLKYLNKMEEIGVIRIEKRYGKSGQQISNLYHFISAHEAYMLLERSKQKTDETMQMGVKNLHGGSENISTGDCKNYNPRGEEFTTAGVENLQPNYTQLTIPNITRTNEQENDIQPTAGGASHRDRARENSENTPPQKNGVGIPNPCKVPTHSQWHLTGRKCWNKHYRDHPSRTR
jgi:hypothetical protein